MGGILVGGDDMPSGPSGAHEGVGDDFGLWGGSMSLSEDNPDHPVSFQQLEKQLEQQLEQASGAHEGVGGDFGLWDGSMDLQLDDRNHLGPQDGLPQDQSAEGTSVLGAIDEDEAVAGPEDSSLEPTLAKTTARDDLRC